MEQARLKAPDVHCEGCADSIRRSLGKLDGVTGVDVSVTERTVTVTYDAAVVTVSRIGDRLAMAGFPVSAD
jgi:copper chaperone CopZ